ncbi:hypothetical protein GCM10025868_32120 [Angustibacter aerolatus]|uniref:Serine acetyltransferase n=1 Tax=Angustibacter aerolatus TaxID=1162965 RepID=A0ABQ6JM86_9ACTN|nr:hypothetical protein GCM10025868_32120 [Angustibacter aerolatus]
MVHWQPASAAGRVVRLAARVLHFAANRFVEASTGISVAERASIGPGLYIGHFGGVIIGAVTMGENCTVSHGITIGRSGRTGENTRPTLGDRVWVGPGAVVTGAIHLGDDSVVGANSVVTRDVPARATAVGAPARILPGRPSFEMVVYAGQDDDAGRAASLAAWRRPEIRLDDAETVPEGAGVAGAQDA